MLKVAIGHSSDPDSLSAVEDIIAQCQETFIDILPQAGLLFASIDFDHDLILQHLHQAFPDLELIGCTSDSELSSAQGYQQDSIVLTLFASDELEIRAGVGRNVSKDAIASAKAAIAQAQTAHPAQLCIATPESLTTSGVEILKGLQAILGEAIPVFGGLAADGWQYQNTHQFFKTEVLQDSIPVLIFSGSALRFSHGVGSGWQPVSQAGRVTKADCLTIYEVDDKPATEFCQAYFGDLDLSPDNPLAVFEDGSDQFYMRGFSKVDLEAGSLTTLAEVPQHSILRIATASRDELVTAAKHSILDALDRYPGEEPSALLVFSCSARRRILGTQTKEECQLLQACTQTPIPTSGFYTYGEFSPLTDQASSRLHHHTIVTLLLGTR